MIASRSLDAVDKEKFKKAGVLELVRAASIASDRAGLTSPSAIEYHHYLMRAYELPASPPQHQQTLPEDTPTPLPSPPLDPPA
jgi:hypothetical protein